MTVTLSVGINPNNKVGIYLPYIGGNEARESPPKSVFDPSKAMVVLRRYFTKTRTKQKGFMVGSTLTVL